MTFWKSFGLQLKYGILNGYGMNRDMLADLLIFYSSKEAKLVPLADYVKNMAEDPEVHLLRLRRERCEAGQAAPRRRTSGRRGTTSSISRTT